MAELLKNIYNTTFFDQFLSSITTLKKDFDKTSFLKHIYTKEWEAMALKERMRHITVTLQQYLSDDYTSNIDFILELIPQLLKDGFSADSLEFIFLPDFVEVYGLEYYDKSIFALEQITQFITCEFAIRHFIVKYEQNALQQMLLWAKHKHPMVRRLATEGARPKLPWAIALKSLQKDPSPILPILELLKNDSSESVRRSVANNLNDISKDNPTIVISLAKKWLGKTPTIDKLVKHGCRTLLKKGNTEVMAFFGFGAIDGIQIKAFGVLTPQVKIGTYLEFGFTLINTASHPAKLRLEYAIHYLKANGSLSPKVFKISEKEYAANSETPIHKKQSFKIITTRKFHKGKHQISIIINGNELKKLDFELV